MRSAFRQKGLSVIEVLVALAIFASTVVLALSSLQFQLHRQHKIAQQQLASHLSNNTAIDLQLETQTWPNTDTRYSVEFADRSWDVKLSPETIQADQWKRLRIEVSFKGNILAEQSVYRQGSESGRPL